MMRGYSEVSFLAEKMFMKLNLPENVAKGDNWADTSLDALLCKLDDEVEELTKEISLADDVAGFERIIAEAADVANFCAFICARSRKAIRHAQDEEFRRKVEERSRASV